MLPDKAEKPILLSEAPAIPALRFNDEQGLRFGNLALSGNVTIFARARYTSKTEYTRRIFTNGRDQSFIVGWNYGTLGFFTIDGARVASSWNADASPDVFGVAAMRNTLQGTSAWFNNNAVSYRPAQSLDYAADDLVLNGNPSKCRFGGGGGSGAQSSAVASLFSFSFSFLFPGHHPRLLPACLPLLDIT